MHPSSTSRELNHLEALNSVCTLTLSAALLHQSCLRPEYAILRSCRPTSRHLLCKGLEPVGTLLLLSPSKPSAGDGAGAMGSGAVVTKNADVRAASTAVKTVEPRKEEWTRTAMRSHGPTSPPAATGLSLRTIVIISRTPSGCQHQCRRDTDAGRGASSCDGSAETEKTAARRRGVRVRINGESGHAPGSLAEEAAVAAGA